MVSENHRFNQLLVTPICPFSPKHLSILTPSTPISTIKTSYKLLSGSERFLALVEDTNDVFFNFEKAVLYPQFSSLKVQASQSEGNNT
jgi:NAD kinase